MENKIIGKDPGADYYNAFMKLQNWGRTKVKRRQLWHEIKSKAVFRPQNAILLAKRCI
jgi:hypothetical protein